MADLELESLGNGDGNNYLLRDNSKIPLSGSNAISGDLIPATTDSVNLGSSVKEYLNAYIKSLTINGTACGDILTHNASEFVPRSGGYIMTGSILGRNTNNDAFILYGGTSWGGGSAIALYGTYNSDSYAGGIIIHTYGSPSLDPNMILYPSGTWVWQGQAIQYTSDQRLKQQIANIDDALLDAWEDVELVQFKYNDAVDAKKDKARLHTGYVVQQIDEACQKHDVDISEYGLYCHEEYPEMTEEVTIENEDGTTTKERKVIREASEHYSLRYTETLVVECAYLRRENNKLKQQMLQYAESLSKLEERLKALEQSSK